MKSSRRHRGRRLRHTGDFAHLDIAQPDSDTRAVLTYGQIVGAGGRTSFGFGRFRVI